MMTLAQAHALLPGSVLVGDAGVEFARVHSDTRTLRAGDLFVALKGERFDAHDFLAQAKAGGAVAAIAERGLEAAALPGLLVPDAQQRRCAIADQRGGRQQRVGPGQGHHHAAAPSRKASAAPASSTSEKWCFTPRISW